VQLEIAALLVDDELADQVCEAWDVGEIDSQVVWLAWWLIIEVRFAPAISTGRCNTCVTPVCWSLDAPVRGQLMISRRSRVRHTLAHLSSAPLLASSGRLAPLSLSLRDF